MSAKDYIFESNLKTDQMVYVIVVSVYGPHHKQQLYFPKEVYDDRSRAQEVAVSLTHIFPDGRSAIAQVFEVPYFPTMPYSINQF